MDLHIETFVAPGFGENAYLVWPEGATMAVAVDPGGAAEAMADALAGAGLFLEAILLTHAHVDHLEGVAALVERTGAAVYLHPADRPLYDQAADQAAFFGMSLRAPPPPDHALADGQQLRFGDLVMEVRHVPGHSPGHVILYVPAGSCAFVGDVVFQASIGRTDLPGGNFRQLVEAIRARVLTLPPETTLYPGHGPATSVGHEAKTNPFLIPHYGGGFA